VRWFRPNEKKMDANKDVKGLINALKDEDSSIRWGAAEALGKIGEPAVTPLIQAFKDKDWHGRAEAVAALGYTRNARAIEPLIQAFKDESVAVRYAASKALVNIGEPAVKPLIQAFNDYDEDFIVRELAAKTLEQMGYKRDGDA
jgi:HEAT repeat protein